MKKFSKYLDCIVRYRVFMLDARKRKAQKAAEEELRLKTLKAFKDDRVDKKLMKTAGVQGGESTAVAKEDSNEKSP